jgi:hypothetical protein
LPGARDSGMLTVHWLPSAAMVVSFRVIWNRLEGTHTDQLVRGPLVGCGVNDTSTVELEELEALLLSGRAVARALGKVVQNRSMVRLGPGVPLEGHVTAGGDSDRSLAGSSFL